MALHTPRAGNIAVLRSDMVTCRAHLITCARSQRAVKTPHFRTRFARHRYLYNSGSSEHLVVLTSSPADTAGGRDHLVQCIVPRAVVLRGQLYCPRTSLPSLSGRVLLCLKGALLHIERLGM